MLDARGILSPTYFGKLPGKDDQHYIIAGKPTYHQFGINEMYPAALCYDGTHMYMAGGGNNALYIMDIKTGEALFVEHFRYNPLPDEVQFRTDAPYTDELHRDIYLNTLRNVTGRIDITGIAFDGIDMFAVDAFTNALYKLERK